MSEERWKHVFDVVLGMPLGFSHVAQLFLPPLEADFNTAEKRAKFIEGRVCHINPNSTALDPRLSLGAPAPTNVRCPMPLIITRSFDSYTVSPSDNINEINAFPPYPANIPVIVPNQGGLFSSSEFTGTGQASGDLLVSDSDGKLEVAANNTAAKSYIGRVERGVVASAQGGINVLRFFAWPQFRHAA
jgi:hypothetical protein